MANIFHVKGKEEIVFGRKNVVIACDVVNGKVTHVDVSSELMGYIFAGDEILSINGETNIKTTADFNQKISAKVPGKVSIEFMRDDHCLVTETVLPPRRPNTQMVELTLTYRGGAATGMIIHRMSSDPRTVTMSMVSSSSAACKFVHNGDILVKVNDVYVLSRDAARKLLYASVNSTKTVRLTLERSTTTLPLGPSPDPPTGAKTTACDPLYKVQSKSLVAPPPTNSPTSRLSLTKANKQYDVLLPADVIEIMKKNREFFKKPCNIAPCIVKIVNNSSSVMQPPAIKLEAIAQPEIVIPCDPSPKPLKATPKRVGS
ncbi:unnamed protein product [Caenorhabditis angaria]|uniref:PDZ domain-containing protein n=1 Tax=Caenorhabditis angaria TaxID=860376 RepID=A0A9P1MZM9_9PELO|nr:unnamed protein product [Caenorhabditis angaria]